MGKNNAKIVPNFLYLPTFGAVEDNMVLKCQFNPAELEIKKGTKYNSENIIPGRDFPRTEFKGGKAATYKLKLEFDAYLNDDGTTNVSDSGKISRHDVRDDINKLMAFCLKGGGYAVNAIPFPYLAEPPSVYFVWGDVILFRAIVTDVDAAYTEFESDGTPIHAKATVSFLQQSHPMDFLPAQNPTSRTDPRHTVRVTQGDRLDNIATGFYNDPRMWRAIAEENDVDDPFTLEPGALLSMPNPKNI